MPEKKALYSAVLHYLENIPGTKEDFEAMINSILTQDEVNSEVIVVDHTNGQVKKVLSAAIAKKVKVVAGKFKNRAQGFNAGIKAAKGDYIVFVNNVKGPVVFTKSAFEIYNMTFDRHPKATMIYADYANIAADGSEKDVHLLEWHIGRVRDMWDTGSVVCAPAKVVSAIKGCTEKYNAADWYDLRNKLTAKGEPIHISNRYRGSLYKVKQQAAGHDVFAYLLAGKDVQLEMEAACTDHLKRIGAYLAPGVNYRAVKYTPEEEKQFKKCVASIIIPVNNRPEFIGGAIDSVQRQTMQNCEVIIVVNGGESDPTIPAVKEYMKGGSKFDPKKPAVKLIVVDVNNLGLCLNKGLKAAAGKFYVQLDSDDQLIEDAVEKILKVYEEDPKIGLVVGSYEVWEKQADGSLKRRDDIPVVTHDEWTEENGRNNLLRINGAGAPRSAYIKVIKDAGWFGVNDTPYSRNYGEDYDLVSRIIEKWRMGRVWDPIYKVIRHSGSTDHSIDQVTIDRNDNAKDHMRFEAIHRRIAINEALKAKGEAKKPAAKKSAPKKAKKK